MRRALIVVAIAAASATALAWVAIARLPQWLNKPDAARPSVAIPSTPESVRKIQATLFYISEDGGRLVGVKRDVTYGESTVDQARRIVEAELESAPEPYAAPLPPGTKVLAVFVTDRHEAFVDLSREAAADHMGGSLDELLTVYAVVNAVTVNLPAVQRVQILVEGQEVDSLAGHVDLRHPLPSNLAWVVASPSSADTPDRAPDAGAPAPASPPATTPSGAMP